MSWFLLILGLICAPVFTRQLIKGIRSGVIRGTNSDIHRVENPVVFKMAVVLNSVFALAACWFVVEGIRRLIA